MFISAVFIALGWLVIRHFMQIIKSETSIEAHINNLERVKSAKYRKQKSQNPYDLGWRENLKIYLGIEIDDFNHTWLRLLHPSFYKPREDGLTFLTKPNSIMSNEIH